MSEASNSAIQKLTIVKELSQANEIKQITKIMIEYIKDHEESDMGFNGKTKK